MIQLVKTNGDNKTFQQLATELEEELKIRDGAEHEFYAELNKIDNIRYVIIAYSSEIAVGCGAIREYSKEAVEIKRMFVKKESRKAGVASAILKGLEDCARELGYNKCVLETGINQPEAVSFYKKHNYQVIPRFGIYITSENSICFEKPIK